MKVTIKTLDGKMFEVSLEPEMLVSDAKAIIASASPEQSFTVERQKLIYSGKVMDNTKTLAEYSVADKGFIVCMLSKVVAAAVAAPAPAPHPNAAAQQPPHHDHDHQQGDLEDDEDDLEDDDEDGMNEEAMVAQLAQLDPATVANLVAITAMPEPNVRMALVMAQGNADVAADYLMNGMPDDDDEEGDGEYDGEDGYGDAVAAAFGEGQMQQQQQQQQGGNVAGMDFGGLDIAAAVAAAQQQTQQQQGAAPAGGNPLEQLRAHPEFDELRQVVQNNPAMLQTVIQQISAMSPEMLEAIQSNPAAFLAMLNEPIAAAPAAAPPAAAATAALAGAFDAAAPAPAATPAASAQQLSPEETAAVARLCEMGFAHERVMEAFIACDRNEEHAANFLFDSM